MVLAVALVVPLARIVGRLRRNEADDTDKTVFVFLFMGLCFFVAFLRWWFMPWFRQVF